MNEALTVRVLHFVPEPLPTFRADVAVMFGKYLPRHQVLCDIVGKTGKADITEQGFASLRRSSNAGGRLRQEWAFMLLCLRSMFAAKRNNCDVMQVRDMVGIGVLGLVIAKLKGIPYAYWMSFLMNEGRIGRARAEIAKGGGLRYRIVLLKGLIEVFLLDKIILPNADHVFVQSEAMKDLIATRGISKDKMTAVPMGVDGEALLAREIVPQRLPGWEGIPVIAYLGTLDRSRELEVVIDAVKILTTHYPQVRLLFIGDSPTASDLTALRAHAVQQGLDNALHITGWLDAKKAWPLLAGADAAVSYIPRGPLFDISSPTKSLEYLALAMPCVGNDTPDQVQVLQASQAGWLTGSTPAALAEAMLDILRDPERAKQRASLGPAYIEAQRSYRVLAQALASRYQHIVRSLRK